MIYHHTVKNIINFIHIIMHKPRLYSRLHGLALIVFKFCPLDRK